MLSEKLTFGVDGQATEICSAPQRQGLVATVDEHLEAGQTRLLSWNRLTTVTHPKEIQ